MIFNNIIYFILVLLLFNINRPGPAPTLPLPVCFGMALLTWWVFAWFCRRSFRAILNQASHWPGDPGRFTGKYLRLVSGYSVLAVFLFGLDVYLLDLKFWIQLIPGSEILSILRGLLALGVYVFYLATIWYLAHPVYVSIFRAPISRGSYVRSNLKLNLPILFPWAVLSLLYDLLALSPWGGSSGFLGGVAGETVLFAAGLTILMILMPGLVQHWWGCRPIRGNAKAESLRAFLDEKQFKYRNLVTWPIFEGKMMTAGIMGILPRFRYILVTDSLLEILTLEELKAVLAHEMGHAKYRHLLLYVLFFVGYVVLAYGVFDIIFYFFAVHPLFDRLLYGDDHGINLFYLILSLPMLAVLYVYFRYLMGFFMRHFERQADLYSADVMGTPGYTISSLEKIAYASGRSRNLPSWHHFSIRERVECLRRTLLDPALHRRHNRFILISLVLYLFSVGGMSYAVNFSPLKNHLTYTLAGKALKEEIRREPGNLDLYTSLAAVYQEMGEWEKAAEVYEKIIQLNPRQAVALNNLAWLLVTAPDRSLRDDSRGLLLSKRAVEIERSPVFLDTLAEAYFANGDVQDAVRTIKEAISLAQGDRSYYEKQLKRFLSASGASGGETGEEEGKRS